MSPQAFDLRQAQYLRSVHEPVQLPPDGGIEIAVAGRSNAGKSSALNKLCDNSRLARTSKTPGRTQQLVFFEVAAQVYLVDLPGYGYAEVPLPLRAHWRALIEHYFQARQALAGLVLVMDCRHPLKDYDRQMLAFAAARGLPTLSLLTKADKLPRGQQAKQLATVRRELGERGEVVLFSAHDGQGVDAARARLQDWLNARSG